MTVYVMIVILTRTTSFEPVRNIEVVTNQAVFATAERCLRNKVHNEAHYRELKHWDNIQIDCIPQEVLKGK